MDVVGESSDVVLALPYLRKMVTLTMKEYPLSVSLSFLSLCIGSCVIPS